MQTQQPPPGVQWTDLVPKVGRPRRTGLVVASGFLMIVSGGFGVMVALVLLMSEFPTPISPSAERLVNVIALVALALGVLQALAGILILGQSRIGRTLGLFVAALGVVGSVLQLGFAPGRGLIGLVLNGMVLYALTAHTHVFGNFDD